MIQISILYKYTTMTKQNTQKDYEHVNLILKEAEKHGLRWEV